MTQKRRKAKSGGGRTEVFALRLDPRLKYLAEIAARKQRRSLANFVEWSIEQALSQVFLVEPNIARSGEGETVLQASSYLWALDEFERIELLSNEYPELLTYEEQLIWRVIDEHYLVRPDSFELCKFRDESGVQNYLVRACWEQIKAYALGKGTIEELNAAFLNALEVPF